MKHQNLLWRTFSVLTIAILLTGLVAPALNARAAPNLHMNADKTVDATFNSSVTPEPNDDISVNSLSATLAPNKTDVQTFEICNSGTSPLTYTLSEIPATELLGLQTMGPLAVPGSGSGYSPMPNPTPRHSPGVDSINPAVSEFGLISWSIDGLGTIDTGIIQVEKPAGATVRGAYIAGASSPFVTTPDGAITINGGGVTWDPSKTVPGIFGMTNTWADVTSIVKPIVDAAPTGRVDLSIVDEGNTNESMSLIVIFDDPNQTAPSTIILMMGAQASEGDTFQVGLANPIDKGLPGFAMDMSLGIAFSYQEYGSQQYSLVDVNGQRLTTAAGGSDDAAEEPNDGNLATTGGLDDSNANPPDPYAPPTNGRSDDELYTLVPYVNNGDTSITVFTQNPSNDDNIYFTGFYFGATTASVGESILLNPVSAVREVGATHTVTAFVQNDQGDPVAGRLVNFNVTAGPNTGQTGTDTTDSNGEATFTYSSAVVGTDTLLATADKSSGGSMNSNPVTVEWQISTPVGIPWLDEIPTSGTILPSECTVISVTFDSTGLTNGVYTGTLQITTNDPETPVTDLPVTLNVDGIAPAAPVIVTPAEGSAVNDTTPTISGTAEAGSTVTVMEGLTVLCTAVADVSGNWSCDPTTPLSEGAHTISATATDGVGNISDPATRHFTVDSVAPAAPVIVTPAEGSVISDTTPTISGTAEPGSTVTVMEGLTVLCTAVANVSGNWSCDPTTPLSEGAHTISATATDEAGNVSDPATRDFTVDSVAPAAPVIVTPAEGSVISDTTPTISGNAEAGSTVTVMEGEIVLCTAVADVSGNWSCDPSTPLSEGAHTISATATDELGNVSDPATRHFTVDSVAPAAPVIVTPAEGAVISDTTPTISGTAEAGSTVSVMEGLTVLCTAVTNGSGIWSCVPTTPLSEGAHTISATATDEAGNVSDPATRDFTVDSVAPAAPVIVTPAEGSVISDTTPTISGTAEAGSTVTVMEGLTVLCTAVTNVSGNWSCDPTTPLSEGAHTISATATDELGNVSDPATRHFTVDSVAPAAPAIVTPAEGSVISDTTPTISGTAEAGSTVTVMEGEIVLCTAVADVSGNWSCDPSTPLSEGAHTISATATDELGNVSDPATRHFTVDSVAPAAPVIVTPAEGAVISDTTPTISGTAEPGSTVTVMEGETVLCTAVTNGSGIWSCVPTTPLSEGAHTISATATDEAGNVSNPATRYFTVDSVAPAAPVIVTPAEGSVISDTTPTISGNAEDGSTVTVMEGETVLCTAVTNSSGIWSCVASTPLSEGAHTISATATDGVGNMSDPATRSFTIQVSLPDADLSVSINAVRSVVDITYTIVIRNDGPSLADGAVVSATFAAEASSITWICTGAGGAVCGGSGSGTLYDTLASLPEGGSVTYIVHASVMLTSADCDVTITPPASVNDPNLANNRAFYHIYRITIPLVVNRSKP